MKVSPLSVGPWSFVLRGIAGGQGESSLPLARRVEESFCVKWDVLVRSIVLLLHCAAANLVGGILPRMLCERQVGKHRAGLGQRG